MMQPRTIRAVASDNSSIADSWFHWCATAALIGALLAIGASPARSASSMEPAPLAGFQRANLDEFEKFDIDDLDEKYRTWMDEIDIIMTKDEREVFVRLESDFQRDSFMERFWLVRDPSPGTPKNEYKEEHYRRLEYIERHFGTDSPRPAWMTDRGRMYVLLGEPMNTKNLDNTQMAYPVQIWFYHANPRLGIPPFFSLVFFKSNGVGEFRLYSPLVDGPWKLLNPSGESYARGIQSYNEETGGGGFLAQSAGEIGAAYEALQQVDAELARASLSLLPGDYAATEGFPSMRSQMMIGDIEMIPQRVMPNAQWAYPILTGMVEADVRFESLPINALAVALLDTSGIPFIHYGVLTQGGRLNLNNYEDIWYLTFEVAGSVIDEQNRVITGISGANEAGSKILQADLDAEQAQTLRRGPFAYIDRFPAIEGEYEFDLVLENNVSREYGRQSFEIEVPRARPEVVRSSPPILVFDYFEEENYDPYASHYPFQLGKYGMLPSFDGVFRSGDNLHVYMQIYLPERYPERLEVVTQLSDNRGIVIDRVDYVWSIDADQIGTINHFSTLDLADVAPGDYRLRIDIDVDDRPGISLPVKILAADDETPTPYVHMAAGPPPTDPFFAYDRAQQLQILGETEQAIAVLETATSRVAAKEIVDLQMQLLAEAGRWDEVLQLLRPMAVENPNDIELLTALATAHANMGSYFDAIRYFERARFVADEETTAVLNPLASSYFADGQVDKAREILEISLQIDAEQPEIRRLLDEVLKKGQGQRR